MTARHAIDLAQFDEWVPVEIRYSDLDRQGHVNNAVYFTYFEQSRVRFLRVLHERTLADEGRAAPHPAADEPSPSPDFSFVVVSASCFYRRPIAGLAPVAVGVRCAGFSRATLELEYAVCDHPHGQLYATGITTLASVDPATGRPRGLPPWVVRAATATRPLKEE